MHADGLLYPPPQADLPVAVGADGIAIIDADGRRYLDASSGAIACNLGHDAPRVRDAMRRQADQVAFVYRTQFRNRPAEELARRLVERLMGDGAVMFCNSGSEAVEAACRLARTYWTARGRPERRRILGRRISYHGSTQGSLSVSGHFDRRRPVAADLPDLPAIDAPYCYRCPFGRSPDGCGTPCADSLETRLRQIGPEHVAAFIAEPVIGASAAAIAPPAAYWRRIRDICDRYDVLLIADEVMTGLGRLGTDSGCAHYGVAADLMAVGKGLNAGFTPMSAVVASAAVTRALRQGGADLGFGHTHAGNPLSAAICLAVLEELDASGLMDRAVALGRRLSSGLRRLARRHPMIGDVRGVGLLWGVELVADQDRRHPFAADRRVADRLVAAARAEGLLIYPSRGFLGAGEGDAVIVAPPLVATDADIDAILRRLGRAFDAIARVLETPPTTNATETV